MEIEIESPPEIKELVRTRLKENGIIDKIQRKVNLAIRATVFSEGENLDLQLKSKSSGTFNKAEVNALYQIEEYLHRKGLNYTLQALIQEANIKS